MGFVSNYVRNLGSIALGRQPTRPLLFSYYVTHRCDLACRYCCDGDGKRFKEDPIAELATTEARRLLDALRPSADTLDITGGEPMVRDDLEAILAHAQALGFRTVLNTKGLGLEARGDLVRLADVLVLSIDTLDPAALATLIGRPEATARRVLAALDFAMAHCPEAGTQLVLSTVATPANLDHVAGVLDLAMARGLGFHLSPEIVGTQPNPELRDSSRYRQLVDTVIAHKRRRGGVLGVMAYLEGIRDFGAFRCHPLLMPVVRPDGRMYYPCLESKQADIDVLEHGSYRDALAAAQRRFGRLPECRDCCHIFCHMALSLLQRHPIAALGELRHLRDGRTREAR